MEKKPPVKKMIKEKIKYIDASNHSICKNYNISGTYRC